MQKKVRMGILGCSNIAAKYAIKAFQSLENAEVAHIASRDEAKAQEWSLRFGIHAERSYEALVSNPGIDAVYISLPIGLHKKWALKAASAGKHVMCEKSLGESFNASKEIVEACRSRGVVLYENFMCDVHPQHEKVLSLIKEGGIGKPFVFESNFGFPLPDKNNVRYDRELGGGSLNDTGAYTVFMARKIFGKEPVAVTCDLFNDEEKGVDIQGAAKLEFPDKAIALVAFSFDAVYQNNYSVWGSRGVIRVGRAYSIPPEMKPIVELTTNNGSEESTAHIDAPPANHFELMFHDFCSTIIHKSENRDTIDHKYEALIAQAKVLEAMRISSKEKRMVRLTEIQ